MVILLAVLTMLATPLPECEPACTLLAKPVQGTIRIDGVLSEADWQTAPFASDFLQYEPTEGAPATHQTEVRILYGTSALYIGATLHDSSPDEILETLGRRDMFTRADWFTVSIDSYFDRKTAYNFAINAGGLQADGIYTGRGSGGGGDDGGRRFPFQSSWDAIWDASARTTATGWEVEMRIPYSMLRFSDASVQRWGINFSRYVPRLDETSEWVMIPSAERSSGTVARYGVLEGIRSIHPRRNLQVIPYSVSQHTTEEGEVERTLFRSTNADVGGDIKVGITSNFTLDATINPDFGQVDADPAELNLTAFESFFPERRPFFTEGTQIFRYDLDRGGSLLYTRRVGSRAPVIGAGKLSGQSGRGLSLGFFGAASGESFSPETYYGVGRVRQQVGRLSSIGGIATYVNRAIDDPVRSVAGGFDWDMRLFDNNVRFDGQISTTRRDVPDEALEQGFALTAGIDRQRSIWNFATGFNLISNGFNPNDLGRLRQNNYFSVRGGVIHQVNGGDPFGPFQRGEAWLFLGNSFSYEDGLSNGFFYFLRSDWTTQRFNRIELGSRGDYLFGGYDIVETRGIGPRKRPREVELEFSITSDVRRNWVAGPAIELQVFGNGGRTIEAGMFGQWDVSSRFSIEAQLQAGRENNVSEWASNEAFAQSLGRWMIADESDTEPEDVEMFVSFAQDGSTANALSMAEPYDDVGRHYLPVFGRRDTRGVDATLRSSITLTPKLSLQFYGQLFVARGTYDDLGILTNRDAIVPVSDFPKLYDFSVSSFQTNSVVRWEYRPGSTLFVVWSQSRRGDDDFDAFASADMSPFEQGSLNQLRDTFDIFPTNVFLVKLSYTFLR